MTQEEEKATEQEEEEEMIQEVEKAPEEEDEEAKRVEERKKRGTWSELSVPKQLQQLYSCDKDRVLTDSLLGSAKARSCANLQHGSGIHET